MGDGPNVGGGWGTNGLRRALIVANIRARRRELPPHLDPNHRPESDHPLAIRPRPARSLPTRPVGPLNRRCRRCGSDSHLRGGHRLPSRVGTWGQLRFLIVARPGGRHEVGFEFRQSEIFPFLSLVEK
jgi:hypothetical protein